MNTSLRRNVVSLATLFLTVLLSTLFPDIFVPVYSKTKDTRPQVVRIITQNDGQRQWLVSSGIDLLEQRTADDLFAIVSPSQHQMLVAEGLNVKVDTEQTAQLDASALPNVFRQGYRTIEETEAFLQTSAETYPKLATVVDYGNSWEKEQANGDGGHDLWAIRLTNQATPGPKPVLLLIGAMHAREIVTSELSTRYITYLLGQYGRDAEVTWLLNEYEVVVIPIANPDGRELVEQGYLQRKNTNPSGAQCIASPTINYQAGVDLNRNFSFAWGVINNGSTPPCSETFPGTAPGSEPETAALQAFIQTLFSDQRGANINDAAPPTTSGVVISLHSYSNLVLWPWGYTNEPAPNDAALKLLGTKLASFNGYKPQQSFKLYPTSGTIDDWVYGELGVASFTFEVGPSNASACTSFFPAFECLDDGNGGRFWPLNLPAFLYATHVVRAPYTQPAGPEISEIQIISDTQQVTITARIESSSGFPIEAAELYLDRSPWQGGSSIPLLPLDGAFNSIREQGYAVVPGYMLTQSSLVLIRGQSTEWGPFQASWATASEASEPITRTALWLPFVRNR